MILKETIEEVKSRMDILDVVSDFITLKKAGHQYKALSPFTNEKTPSFYVVPARGIFKDFSSGKGGDPFTFLMEHEGMSYTEAIRYLAKKYGIEVKESVATETESAQQNERDGLLILMNYAKDYYCHNLYHLEEGQGIGLSYFRERGFNDKTIAKFELGYALNSWEHFSKAAESSGYNKDLLEKAGLIVKKDDGSSYDRFRGRVIFPVHNISGKVIAFGARMLGKENLSEGKQGHQPKYINSPETEVYHKSQVLYGLYQAKNSIRQQDTCYLVEGYTDVISLHQAGIENVVASSGTALTEEQIKLIRRFTENVTVLFDGDAAGIKAALRGIDLILKGGLNVRVVLFPDGEDPDSYSRKLGSAEFEKFLKGNKRDFISFKAGLYAEEAAGDPIRRAESIREIITSIALIPDPVKRTVYIQETAVLLKIGEEVLISELNKVLIEERRKGERERSRNERNEPLLIDAATEMASPPQLDAGGMVQYQERETIRLLLNYADKNVEEQTLSDFLFHELEDVTFSNQVFGEIYEAFKAGWLKGDLRDSFYFLQHGSEEVKKVVTDLITKRYSASENWSKFHIHPPREEEKLDEMSYTNVLRLKLRIIQQLLEINKDKIQVAEKSGNEPEVDNLLTTQIGLDQAKRELSDLLGIVIVR